ncbi:MAG: M20/M25/M40 family metallo-hydrolase [Thermoplasmata archaeon]|nr:M20/M25/M40 family metallo-hydrolase [Thermoplasmata archaeon]
MTRTSIKDLIEGSKGMQRTAFDVLSEQVKYHSVAAREKEETRKCADAVERQFKERGYKVTRYAISDAPVLLAEKNVGAPKTLMFYHHYDVQPEGEIGLWKSSPWVLTERDGRAYGRGTIDDKGPLVVSMMGIDLAEKVLGRLPVNVKFIVEGEEETGPISLPWFAKTYPDLIKADGCIWEGASAIPGSSSEVIAGMKGDAYFELHVGGPPRFPRTDVHSGEGGLVPNAAWRLVWALNSIKDDRGNVLIKGFNELAGVPAREDVEVLSRYKRDVRTLYKEDYGLEHFAASGSNLEMLTALYLRPVVSISGLTSGYQGPEDATIVPAQAHAKLDIRLVPGQTMDKVDELLRGHLAEKGFSDVQVTFRGGYDPAKTPTTDPFIRLMHEVSSEFVAPANADIVPMTGSSGPVAFFTPHTPICMTGSLADVEGTNIHAPDENMPMKSLIHGIAFTAAVAERMAEARKA